MREAPRRREPRRAGSRDRSGAAAGAAAGGGGRRTGTRGRGSGATRQQQRRQQPPQRKTRQEPAGNSAGRRLAQARLPGADLGRLRRRRRDRHPRRRARDERRRGFSGARPSPPGRRASSRSAPTPAGATGRSCERANGLYDQGAAAFDAEQYDQGAAYFEAAAKVYAAAWKQQSTDPGVGTDYATSLFYSGADRACPQPDREGPGAVARVPDRLVQQGQLPGGEGAAGRRGRRRQDRQGGLRGRSRRLPEGGQRWTRPRPRASRPSSVWTSCPSRTPAQPRATPAGDARRRLRAARDERTGALHQNLVLDGLEDIRRQSRATVPPPTDPGVCWAPEEAPRRRTETGERMDHQSGEGDRLQASLFPMSAVRGSASQAGPPPRARVTPWSNCCPRSPRR